MMSENKNIYFCTMNKIVEDKIKELTELCIKYSVDNLYVFGSVNSAHFNAKSDIDILISFNKEIGIDEYSENYFLLHAQLKNLFNRDIDLLTDNSLSNPYFIQAIEQTKQLVYAA